VKASNSQTHDNEKSRHTLKAATTAKRTTKTNRHALKAAAINRRRKRPHRKIIQALQNRKEHITKNALRTRFCVFVETDDRRIMYIIHCFSPLNEHTHPKDDARRGNTSREFHALQQPPPHTIIIHRKKNQRPPNDDHQHPSLDFQHIPLIHSSQFNQANKIGYFMCQNERCTPALKNKSNQKRVQPMSKNQQHKPLNF
jgi:hypothetical protein